jgi:hypothetical protein
VVAVVVVVVAAGVAPVRRGMSGARERAGSGKGGITSRGTAPGAGERACIK